MYIIDLENAYLNLFICLQTLTKSPAKNLLKYLYYPFLKDTSPKNYKIISIFKNPILEKGSTVLLLLLCHAQGIPPGF